MIKISFRKIICYIKCFSCFIINYVLANFSKVRQERFDTLAKKMEW